MLFIESGLVYACIFIKMTAYDKKIFYLATLVFTEHMTGHSKMENLMKLCNLASIFNGWISDVVWNDHVSDLLSIFDSVFTATTPVIRNNQPKVLE